jgi:hypothetical protein
VCDEVNAFVPEFTDDVARWAAQDALGGWPTDPVVFVGSSTIRRWEGLASAYSDRSPWQRGFGGAQLGEVALLADTLINRHAPRAGVVFAGTNDDAAGVPAEVVAARLRCLRARVSAPLVFVGITPTPARWSSWPVAEVVNAAAAALAEADPGVEYVDVATPFLATGDAPGALFFRGLDPSKRFDLALFAARDDAERRVTRFVVTGAEQVEGTLQTSGAGAGADGATTNDDTVLRLGGLRPDAQGHLFVDVQIAEGTYAYLSALELTAAE